MKVTWYVTAVYITLKCEVVVFSLCLPVVLPYMCVLIIKCVLLVLLTANQSLFLDDLAFECWFCCDTC